jgi:23S rRNA pseudouridine2605 synthase
MSKTTTPERLRLNRFLARSGLGSRRSVEDLVRTGRVTVNGRLASGPAMRIQVGRDEVAVDGRLVQPPRLTRIFAFHKPYGVVSTLRPQGNQRGLRSYRDGAGLGGGFVPVGRLDADSTGLLLWTDDGDLAQDLMRPASHIWKRYVVQLDGRPAARQARILSGGGLMLDGRPCLPLRLKRLPGGGGRRWEMEMREGRKRQIRRMFASQGLRVRQLMRTAIGPVRLGSLAPGDFRRLSRREEAALRSAVRRAGLPRGSS